MQALRFRGKYHTEKDVVIHLLFSVSESALKLTKATGVQIENLARLEKDNVE